MKILTFNYEYPPLGGGGGVVHALIAEELAKRHKVCVVTSAYRGLPRREIREGVEIHRVPVVGRRYIDVASLRSMLSYPPGAWLKSWGLMREDRFDVINTHFAVPTGPGGLPAARLARIPHVLSLHGGDIYDPSKKLSPHRLPAVRSVLTWMLELSQVVVAQSSNTRENTYRYYKYSGPIEVIPLGIRQPQVSSVARKDLGLPDDVFLAATVGRLVARKALGQLLRALADPSCAGVHLVIVGEGPERPRLEALSSELFLDNRVIFLGRVEEEKKWQILNCADAYVSSTLHEGFGLVYLEAMAAGLPIVTFDHGGQMDFLRDGETGYLVQAGNVDELAAAINRLQSQPKLASVMRQANRERAKRHRIESCSLQYEKLLERTIAEFAPNGKRR